MAESAKPPIAPQEGEEGFEENEHWSETYKLRAMFGEIVIVLAWVAGFSWLLMMFLPQALDFAEERDPETNAVAVYPQTKADLAGLPKLRYQKDDKGNLIRDEKGNPKIDPDFGHFLVYNDDGTKNYVNIWIWAALVGLPVLIVVYRAIYKKLSLSYTLTDHRLIIREGLFARHERQIRLIQIRDLAVSQNIIQMMFGVGSVMIFSNDADTPELEVEGIRDPREVKERIFKISEEKKSKKEFYMGHA